MKPSFPAEVEIIDAPGESDVVFEATGKAQASIAEAARGAEAFEGAARVGMFSKEPAVRRSAIERVSMERPREQSVRYVWKARDIQPGAYRTLLNMLEIGHHFSGPLESVRLVSASGHGTRLNLSGLLNTPFPARSSRLPFELVLKPNLEDSKEPLIRMEFQREIHDDELKTLEPLFLAWDSIVIRGGYLNDLTDRYPDVDIEESLSGQQTYLAAPNTVEHLFYEFIGAAAAYDALVNAAVVVHHAGRPLSSFEIE
ncbi:MAG: hypothetical protein ACRD26_22720 [Vicinamibacterales bacterium]